jgi:hypothetical protein
MFDIILTQKKGVLKLQIIPPSHHVLRVVYVAAFSKFLFWATRGTLYLPCNFQHRRFPNKSIYISY